MSALPDTPLHHQMTVLLVDDSLAILTIFGELLSPYYNVRVANSGERALEMVDTEPVPDIILLDVMMPRMNGYAVLKALRDNPRRRDIPVIFVSAASATENEEFGLSLGAVDFIHKPIKPALLLARMKTYLTLMAERNALEHEIDFLHGEIIRMETEQRELHYVSMDALKAMETLKMEALKVEARAPLMAPQPPAASAHGEVPGSGDASLWASLDAPLIPPRTATMNAENFKSFRPLPSVAWT